MIVVICVDDKNGIGFNRRRQSRDRLLIADLVEYSQGRKILISGYSATLFSGFEVNTEIRENLLDEAGEDDICFLENVDPAPYADRISGLVIYRWNRHYPSDKWLSLDTTAFRTVSVKEFEGSSHECITREEMTR